MISFKKQRYLGVTLLETLLVLAIGASILVFSIKQYQYYRLDADIQEVKYNVDTIFEALAGYHKVNCYGDIDPAQANQVPYGQIVPGALNPDNPKITNLTKSIPIDINLDLVQNGFWPISRPPAPSSGAQPPLIPQTPLVDSGGPGYQGYVAQFNPYVSDRVVCTQPAGTAKVVNPTNTAQCTTATTMATVIMWKAQVAVLLGDPRIASDPTLATSYLNLMGGDCLSDYDAGTQTVTPCSQVTSGGGTSGGGTSGGGTSGGGSATGNYVVWERLPALASPKTQSSYWPTNPTVQQFTQMYRTYPMLYLLSPSSGSSTSTGKIPSGKPQYIYCGS